MQDRVFNAALAGLLHDVGKIVQRSRADPWKPAQGMDDEGQPVHATWSMEFIRNNVPESYRATARHGAYHHQPERSPAADKSLSTLVALADKLSAGERADPPEKAKTGRPPQQMVSIFDRVSLSGEEKTSKYHYLPLSPLELEDDVIFPIETPDQKGQTGAYDRLRGMLEQAVKQEVNDRQTYLERVLSAFQQCSWCVPSAYYHSLPDVSLYDHSRSTAALAVCLSELDPSRVERLLGAVRRNFSANLQEGDQELLDEPVALLVGGDISGIQKFIYTLSSKGAAKTLRGRSFYLQLLTEALLRYVLRELGLPCTNVIYSGGGHFYLLAPLSSAGKLQDISRKISSTLLEHHGVDLYLALAFAEVPASGFRLGEFPTYWSQMHAALIQVKQRRYSELGDEVYELVFKPQEHGGNRETTCSVCGKDSRSVAPLKDEDPGDKICALCGSFEKQIGKHLPNADFVVLGFGEPQPSKPGTALDVLSALGMSICFTRKNDLDVEMPDDVQDLQRAVVWALDDADKWPNVKDLPASHILRYTVNQVPQMNFDDLQKKSHGIPRLGVLRMDVDNLGEIFKNGFGKGERSIATLARLSTLSFQLSLFFDGWIKRLCEEQSKYIYAVYAGGDDVFLIGPWDQMPELACSISNQFAEYTAHNPNLLISGGMAFIRGKYPVYQAADDAGQALDKSKDKEGKNAFTFLDHTWKWDQFIQITEKFNRLLKIVQGKEEGGLGGTQSILQVLQNLAEMEADKAHRLKGRPVWGPWMWRGDYQLKRMTEQVKKKNPELANEIDYVLNELRPLYRDIPQWGVAARWVQLYVRKKSEKNNI